MYVGSHRALYSCIMDGLSTIVHKPTVPDLAIRQDGTFKPISNPR